MAVLLLLAVLGGASLDPGIRPFLNSDCVSCHGRENPKSDLALVALARDARAWELVLERLEAGDMPPRKATVKKHPSATLRRDVIARIRAAACTCRSWIAWA